MKEFNLLRDVPYIHNTDELAEFLKPLYIISDYMVDEVTYGMFRDKLLNLVRGSFTKQIKKHTNYNLDIFM